MTSVTTDAVRASVASESGNVGYVYTVAGVAALGGLLFGFDTAVINGAIVFLRRDFALTDFQTELAASSILIGCVIGASVAGALNDSFGRKKVLFAAAMLFLLSAISAALSANLAQFAIARLVGGLAIGVASMSSPLYIAEIAPATIRGRLVTLNQMAIVTGILCAYVVNWLLSDLGAASWRWMFAVAALPSLLFMLALFFVPESPRWLIARGRVEEALAILIKLAGQQQAPIQVGEIEKAIAREQASVTRLWHSKLRTPLFIALALAVLQQITGINTILYYGSIIFTDYAQQNASSAIGANTAIGAINFIGTIVALWIIDRVGRKPLLLIASGGMTASLALLVGAFYLQAASSIILLLILCYVACFAVGLGPGVWVLMSELFPTAVRGRAMSLATISLWTACTLITLTFLSLVNAVGVSGAFGMYATLSLLTFIFVWRAVPETKGKSLEEIERWWK